MDIKLFCPICNQRTTIGIISSTRYGIYCGGCKLMLYFDLPGYLNKNIKRYILKKLYLLSVKWDQLKIIK